jgi:hypothetical protein
MTDEQIGQPQPRRWWAEILFNDGTFKFIFFDELEDVHHYANELGEETIYKIIIAHNRQSPGQSVSGPPFRGR